MKQVLYCCDGRQCKECKSSIGLVNCQYTTDIDHAKNFRKEDDTYVEKGYSQTEENIQTIVCMMNNALMKIGELVLNMSKLLSDVVGDIYGDKK